MGQANLVEITSLSAYLGTCIKFSVFAFLQKELKRKNILQKITNAPVTHSDEAAIYTCFLKTYTEEAALLLPENRIVYRYSREQDPSLKEIAAEMQVAHKTGENHLCRALQTLRVILRSVYHTPALIFILQFLRTLYLS